MASKRRRVGIVGYGKLGQYLCQALLEDTPLSRTHALAFVWNRSLSRLEDSVPAEYHLASLDDFERYEPDLIVEVAHPNISRAHGVRFLSYCDYLIGSPTAFADREVEQALREACGREHGHGLYVPRGALPGLDEILRLRRIGLLHDARITMRKHPNSIRYTAPLDPPISETQRERVLYNGPLRALCDRAPNNVNTMAVLALASGLGFDTLWARLVVNPYLKHHVTEVTLIGPPGAGPRFSLEIRRKSPAGTTHVTSSATFHSFLDSLQSARGKGPGLHFC